MGGTIFLGRWLPSTRNPTPLPTRSRSSNLLRRDQAMPPRRLVLPSPPLVLIITLLCAVSAQPAASAEPSDREEEGLVGAVRSVETRESLLVQTDRFDAGGRLIERIQGGVETSLALWPLRFLDRKSTRLNSSHQKISY